MLHIVSRAIPVEKGGDTGKSGWKHSDTIWLFAHISQASLGIGARGCEEDVAEDLILSGLSFLQVFKLVRGQGGPWTLFRWSLVLRHLHDMGKNPAIHEEAKCAVRQLKSMYRRLWFKEMEPTSRIGK